MFASNFRWFDPWREFGAVDDWMERMASNMRGSASGRGFPAVNYYTEGDTAVVTAEIPGVEPGDIDISVEGRVFTVSGERKPEELKKGEGYHRRERWHGPFKRTVELPFEVEPAKVEARFDHGVLTVVLPRAESEKPRKITVSSN